MTKEAPQGSPKGSNRSQDAGMTGGQFYSEYTGVLLFFLIILNRLVIYHNLQKQSTTEALLGFLKFFPGNFVAIVSIALNLYFRIFLYPQRKFLAREFLGVQYMLIRMNEQLYNEKKSLFHSQLSISPPSNPMSSLQRCFL